MSQTMESLHRRLKGTDDLKSVVKTMKTLAAVNISQYEKAVLSLKDYYRTVELGLIAYLRTSAPQPYADKRNSKTSNTGLVVFGSDQGMVGQFNDSLAEFVIQKSNNLPGKKIIWPVGERVYSRLSDSGLPLESCSRVPDSVSGITPLISRILNDIQKRKKSEQISRIIICFNHPKSNISYEPLSQSLLPLDQAWFENLKTKKWPSRRLPQVIPPGIAGLPALIREYLFVSLFKACAESLASENATRLMAMQGAEKNINELFDRLQAQFHQKRQNSITEELFDVISGYEALTTS